MKQNTTNIKLNQILEHIESLQKKTDKLHKRLEEVRVDTSELNLGKQRCNLD